MDDERFYRKLTVEIEAFGFCEVHTGWRLRFAASACASLHYCLSGEGVMRLENGREIVLREGVLILLPAGIGHSFEAGPSVLSECNGDRHGQAKVTALNVYRAGTSDGEPLVVACGDIQLGCGDAARLLDWLDRPIVTGDVDLAHAGRAMQALFAELQDTGTGSVALTETLLKEILIRVLRTRPESDLSAASGLLDITDRRLGKALDLILKGSAGRVTIATLGGQAGMSRTVLFEQFRRAFGMSPMQFLCEVRLSNAARMLSTARCPIGDTARAVGVSSRSHFNREFRRKYGQTPTEFQKSRI